MWAAASASFLKRWSCRPSNAAAKGRTSNYPVSHHFTHERAVNLMRKSKGRLPGPAYDLGLVRRSSSRLSAECYFDRPNIIAFHTQLNLDERDNFLACKGFDIVTNGLAVRPRTGLNPFLVRLEQGILDTNAEAVLIPGCRKQENTGELFGATLGEDWLTIRKADDPAWRKLELPKNDRARMEQALTAGYVIVVFRNVPAHAGLTSVSWWQVDPKTGEILGIGPRGWRQAASEFLMMVSVLDIAVAAFAFEFVPAYHHGTFFQTIVELLRGSSISDAANGGINSAVDH
jgi:hypothetical protein